MEGMHDAAATNATEGGPGQDTGLADAFARVPQPEDWTHIGWFDDELTDDEVEGLERWGCFVPQAWP